MSLNLRLSPDECTDILASLRSRATQLHNHADACLMRNQFKTANTFRCTAERYGRLADRIMREGADIEIAPQGERPGASIAEVTP